MSLPSLESPRVLEVGPLLASAPASQIDGSRRTFAARVHTTRSTLDPIWSRLETEGHSTAYQTRVWINGIVAHLAEPAGVKLLFVDLTDADSGETCMLLPLAMTRRLGLRVINWLSLGVCDYVTPLLAPGIVWTVEDAAIAWRTIRAVLPKVDLIDLSPIPPDVGGAANPFMLLDECRRIDLEAYGFSVDGDPETFLARVLGAKGHKNFLKRKRRLDGQGAVRFVEAKTETELDDMFKTMLAHRLERFRKLGRADILAKPGVASFYRDAAFRSLRDNGPAKVLGISIDGEWVVTAYVLVHSRVFHGIILAIGDERWVKFSPGLQMVCALMDWSARQGHVYYDLTVGNLPYKADLGAQPRILYRIARAETLAGWCAMRSGALAADARTWLRRHPKAFGAAQLARQRLRRAFSTVQGPFD